MKWFLNTSRSAVFKPQQRHTEPWFLPQASPSPSLPNSRLKKNSRSPQSLYILADGARLCPQQFLKKPVVLLRGDIAPFLICGRCLDVLLTNPFLGLGNSYFLFKFIFSLRHEKGFPCIIPMSCTCVSIKEMLLQA